VEEAAVEVMPLATYKAEGMVPWKNKDESKERLAANGLMVSATMRP
jgi:hypothetical protein